ncbi:MAG: hypothetical protein V3T21_02025 [Candidatus Margulisiibacteriota bacterium]
MYISSVSGQNSMQNIPGGDLKGIARDFYSEMSSLLWEYATPGPTTVRGIQLDDEDKMSFIGTTLFQLQLSEIDKMLGFFIETESNMAAMEKDMGRAFSSV